MLRYETNLKSKIHKQTIKYGVTMMCRKAQQEIFQEKYSDLLSNKRIPKDSKILKLLPYLDEKNVLRVFECFRRIDNCELLPITTKRPIILSESINNSHRKLLP